MAQTYEPTKTWTFNPKSLSARFFLWNYYDSSPPTHVSFCKWFWGWIFMWITVPVHLFVLTVQTLCQAVAWPFKALKRSGKTRRAKRTAENIAWWREEWYVKAKPVYFHISGHVVYLNYRNENIHNNAHEFNIWDRIPIEPPEPKDETVKPEPVQPNVPSRMVEAISAAVDRTVAWFQAHPEIGRRTGLVMTWIGQMLVRFIFYPLAFIVPIAAVTFTGYEIWEHHHGPQRLGHAVWSDSINGLHSGVNDGWKPLLFSLGAGIFAVSLVMFICWILMAADKLGPPQEDTKLYYVMRANKPAPRMAVLAGKALGGLSTAVGWFCVFVLFAPIYYLFKWIIIPGAKEVGRGAVGFGQFMVMGHHTIKSRTCPRIEFKSPEELQSS